ncbi:MFS transporter [Corynebacterium bovis]
MTEKKPRPHNSDSVSPLIPAARSIAWSAVIAGTLAVLLDGFDSAAMSFLIPTLAHQRGVAPQYFTVPLTLTNIGAVLGFLACGRLSARVGQRTVLIGGTAWFGLATVLTALVLPTQLRILLDVTRFLTGLGLGAVLPAAIGLAVARSGQERRHGVSAGVALGIIAGGAVGGMVGGPLIRTVGATGVFWVAGLLPLVLAAVIAAVLPAVGAERAAATGDADAREEHRRQAEVGRMLERGLRVRTLLLWLFSFAVFIAVYALMYWIPTLLLAFGFTPEQAPKGTAVFGLGGVVGGALMVPVVARTGIRRALVVAPVIGGVGAVAAASAHVPAAVTLLLVAGAGVGVTACQVGQLVTAVAFYPAGTRTTAVAWTSAAGRIGSIVGPAVGGILLGLGLSGQDVLRLAVVPLAVAFVAAVGLAVVSVRDARAGRGHGDAGGAGDAGDAGRTAAGAATP